MMFWGIVFGVLAVLLAAGEWFGRRRRHQWTGSRNVEQDERVGRVQLDHARQTLRNHGGSGGSDVGGAS